MKRSASSLLLLFLVACDDEGIVRVRADIAVTPELVDLGQVQIGAVGNGPITVTNLGDAFLRIQGVVVDESLGPEFALVLPEVLQAGQALPANVTFTPVALGVHEGTISIMSDSPKSPVITVRVRAEGVKPALEATPLMLDFQRVVVGTSRTLSVTLINTRDEPLTLLSAGPDAQTSPEFSAQLPADPVLPRAVLTEFAITYTPSELGADAGRVEIVDDTGRLTPLAILVVGEGVNSEIEIEPVVLDFPNITAGQSRTKFFVIRNLGSTPHQVTAVGLESTGTLTGNRHFSLAPASVGTLPITVDGGTARQIDVVYQPTNAGADTDAVVVTSDGIAFPGTVRVTLTGTARGTPVADIDVTPAAIDFGQATVGSEVPREVLLTSAGEADLILSGAPTIDPPSAPYEIVNPPPLTLSPGQVRPMYVVFQPTAAIRSDAELVFTSNDPDESPLRVSLTGLGSQTIAPNLVVDPDPVDFGQVPRAVPASRSVRLRNVGSADLSVSQIAIASSAGGRFALGSMLMTPLVLTPGASSNPFTVSYNDAGSQQLYSGALQVVSNDPLQPTRTVALVAETVPPPTGTIDIRLVVTWDTQNTDIDLHLLRPGGVYFDRTSDNCFCNTNPDWGAIGTIADNPFIDLDDIDGGGPENINLQTAETGTYTVIVHYYDDGANGPSTATITIESRGTVLAMRTQTLSNQDRWDVGTIAWDASSGTGVFTELGSVAASDRSLCE